MREIILKNLPKGYQEVLQYGMLGQYKATGKKLDMGKSCIRFKKLDDLALDVIGQAVAKWPMKKFIAICETAWSGKKN